VAGVRDVPPNADGTCASRGGVGDVDAHTLTLLVIACGAPEQPKPRPLPEDQQTLSPGTYRSEEFEPSLSFRIGEGWTKVPPEASDVLRLMRGETGGFGVSNVREVYKPTAMGTSTVVEAPKDMVGWFQKHPYLQTYKTKPVTVGGVKGVRFDVVLGNLPEDYYGRCGTDCVDLFRFSDGSFEAHPKGAKARVIVLEDVNGKTVTMGFASPIANEFDEYAPEAQKVLDSVEWRGE
jgi:hypothetical protein